MVTNNYMLFDFEDVFKVTSIYLEKKKRNKTKTQHTSQIFNKKVTAKFMYYA